MTNLKKISDFITEKKIYILSIFILLILLAAIFSLAPFDRASGDDYGYGAYTRQAWESTNSLIEVFKASGRTVKDYYGGWQGTWFDIALFSLQPEVFSDNAYFIVPFIMVFIWLGSTLLLADEILHKSFGLTKSGAFLQAIWFFIFTMEFIPGSKASLYWWNGCAHYMIPYSMCILNLVLCIKYIKSKESREGSVENHARRSGKARRISLFAWISIISACLGGASYQAALFNLLMLIAIGGYELFILARQKKNYGFVVWLIFPVILELIGLIISAKSPGNKIRGGEEFGFSIKSAVSTIALCFKSVAVEGFGYIKRAPVMLVILIFLFVLLWEYFSNHPLKIRYSPIIALFLVCVSAAMFAPEIYADVEVSTGTYNFDFQIFWLCVYGECILLSSFLGRKIKLRHEAVGITMLICIVLVVPFRRNLKESLTFKIYEYLSSGQAADYKEQMDLQTRLLETDELVVTVPMINPEQGPLMHMPVTEDPEAWTNTVTAKFYGKRQIIGVPRDEYL